MKVAVNNLRKNLESRYKEEWVYRSSDFEVLQEVAKSTGTITEFITEYVLDPKAETTRKIGGESPDLVILSTIHSAKGLEAQNVHVIDVNPFNYPSPRTMKHGVDAIEEERRCLYVALTRAKDKLNIYRLKRSLQTEYSDSESRGDNQYFLKNLPFDLVNIVVSGQVVSDYPRTCNDKRQEASFPDFNFD